MAYPNAYVKGSSTIRLNYRSANLESFGGIKNRGFSYILCEAFSWQ